MKHLFKTLKKRWWLALVLVVVVGFVLNRFVFSRSKITGTPYTVSRQNVKEELTFSGQIDATDRAVLRFQGSGMLSWVGVHEGDTVRKYQAVAALDQRSLKKDLQKKLNTYVNERIDFDNTKQDTQEKALPMDKLLRQDVLDAYTKAQYDLKSSVLDVELSDIALRYATLTTPIDGVVVRMGTKYAGVNVTPTQSEIEVVNPDTIYFSAVADQTEVVYLASGSATTIRFDPYPDEEVRGNINEIAYTPKEGETGTVYEVKIVMDNVNLSNKYRIGMTGDASFITKQKQQALVVPSTYIKSDGDYKYVNVLTGNKKSKQRITEGDTYDTFTEVTSGLAEGDVVVDE